MTRAPLALVVAMNRDRLIGADGGLPWHIPEDLKHYKRTTMGHAILMGRVTWDSIGRPLPGRHNIVITRNQELVLKGADVVHSVEAAIALARARGDNEPCIIGGATIYAAALPLVTTLHVTEVDHAADGDTFFPALVEGEWEEVERRQGETPGVVFRTLKRVGG